MGVTPDIKTVKARISQRQLQLSRDTTVQLPLQAAVPDSETSWLHIGFNSEMW